MASYNISDPGIARGFDILARALIPSVNDIIAADQARLKSQEIVANTGRLNADAARIAADRDRLAAQAAQLNAYRQAASDLAAVLTNEGVNVSDPQTRARLAAMAVQMQDGLEKAPSALTGLGTFIDPNFAGSDDAFANILLGTGVVGDYAKTRPGFDAAERNDLAEAMIEQDRARDVARMEADARMQSARAQAELDAKARAEVQRLQNEGRLSETRLKAELAAQGAPSGGPAPLTITPAIRDRLQEQLEGALEQAFPDASADPALMNELLADLTQRYSQTRNAELALQQVLSGLGTVDGGGWFARDRIMRITPSEATAPAADAAPETAPGGSQPIVKYDRLGRKAVFDPATGRWTIYEADGMGR